METNYIVMEIYTNDFQQVNNYSLNFCIIGIFKDYHSAYMTMKKELDFQCDKKVNQDYIDNDKRDWDEWLKNNEDEWVYTMNYDNNDHIIGTIYMDGEEQYSIHLIEEEVKK